MESIRIQGFIDDQHKLSANVPGTIPPGPITVWIEPSQTTDDETGKDWFAAIARDWAEELADPRQDIYTLSDGQPINEG